MIKPINYIKCKFDKRVLFYEWEWNKLAEKLFGFRGSGCGLIAQQLAKYHPQFVQQHKIINNSQKYEYKTINIYALIRQLGIEWY